MDAHNDRHTFHVLRQVESLGYHVARWSLEDQQEIRASKVGGGERSIVKVQGNGEEATFRAAAELAIMAGIDLRE